jgi:hypothetical protein
MRRNGRRDQHRRGYKAADKKNRLCNQIVHVALLDEICMRESGARRLASLPARTSTTLLSALY